MYRDPMGIIGDLLYKVWEVYGDPMGVIGGRLYEVWEVYGDNIKCLLNWDGMPNRDILPNRD